MKNSWIRWVFMTSAIYDFVLGLAFLITGIKLYDYLGIAPPNHPAYIQFPSCMLILFGLMFYQIARDPQTNRNLMLYGVGLKTSYCSIVLFYAFQQQIPQVWVYFAWIDLIFLALFILAWWRTGSLVR